MVTRYLNQIPLKEAQSILKRFPSPGKSELIPVQESAGRVTAGPVFAAISVPGVRVSAMDGFAVKSQDCQVATEHHPAVITDTVRLNTGNPVPDGYDAVIMIEDITLLEEGISVRTPARPGQHIRPAGEDVRKGRMVLPGGYLIIASDIGALLSYGIVEVPVRTITVGLIPTGGEVVPPGTRPQPGQVIESNTRILEALLRDAGISVIRYGITPDDTAKIRTVLQEAATAADLVVISAGSSAGTRDYTARILEEIGELLFHGVAMKPGKSVLCGKVGDVPVIGLPGYPVAAQAAIRELVLPLLRDWGFTLERGEMIQATVGEHISSDGGIDEFLLLTAGRIGDEILALPQSRGAGGQIAAIKANALLHIKDTREGIAEGEKIQIELLRKRRSLEETLFITGAYDPALDHLDNLMRSKGLTLSLRNTGNFGGVYGLMKGICHAAALISQATPPPDIQNKFPESDLTIITLALLRVGLVFPEREDLQDLSKIRFIAHPSGTVQRELLEAHLARVSEPPVYAQTARSDHAVIDAITSGTADAGVASEYLASEAGLRCMPLGELYLNLVFRSSSSADPRVRLLMDQIRSDEWKSILKPIPGYDTRRSGACIQVRPEHLLSARSKV